LLPLNTVISGDCFQLLKEIPDGRIDLLLTDPPYGINYISRQRVKKVHGRIKNDKNLDWLENWLIEIKRVLKPDAHAYIFCSHHHLDTFLSMAKKHLPYKNLLVWVKNHFGAGDLRGDYAPQHEFIIFCSNGKKKLNGKRTGNVLNFKKIGNKFHATEKPVDLCQHLIEKSTVQGDLVLATFAGSFTTAVACENIKRDWICIEKEERYCKVGAERFFEVFAKTVEM
jgi:site-specific DNA-methyltransferase (adenine-specific)